MFERKFLAGKQTREDGREKIEGKTGNEKIKGLIGSYLPLAAGGMKTARVENKAKSRWWK